MANGIPDNHFLVYSYSQCSQYTEMFTVHCFCLCSLPTLSFVTKVAAGFLIGNWSISINLEKQNGQRIIPLTISLSLSVSFSVGVSEQYLPVHSHCDSSPFALRRDKLWVRTRV